MVGRHGPAVARRVPTAGRREPGATVEGAWTGGVEQWRGVDWPRGAVGGARAAAGGGGEARADGGGTAGGANGGADGDGGRGQNSCRVHGHV